jgi:hypothetical protein
VKSGALGKLALHFDLAPVFLNDSVDNRQPESCSVILRRKKWIENARYILGTNAFTVIANGDA